MLITALPKRFNKRYHNPSDKKILEANYPNRRTIPTEKTPLRDVMPLCAYGAVLFGIPKSPNSIVLFKYPEDFQRAYEEVTEKNLRIETILHFSMKNYRKDHEIPSPTIHKRILKTVMIYAEPKDRKKLVNRLIRSYVRIEKKAYA